MRFTLTFLAITGAFTAATASLVGRQSLPSCAANCLANANFGSCSASDNACLCASQTFVSSTTACIQGACSGADLANAEAYSQAICKAVGVTLTTAGTASATATAPSSSATGSSSASAAAAASTHNAALATNANALTGAAAVGFGVLALVL